MPTDEDLVKESKEIVRIGKNLSPNFRTELDLTSSSAEVPLYSLCNFNNIYHEVISYGKIVECIPNFSEGRNQAVIDSLVE